MLQNVQVKNFVHFYEEQNLSFEKGPYFFIGQNESGKSCMFEAIRRCMSTSKSMGMSSSHKAKEWSFVTCDFSLSESKKVKSCLLRIPKKVEENIKTDVFVKFVFEVDSETKTRELFLDLVKEVDGGWAVNKQLQLDTNSKTKTYEVLCNANENYILKEKVEFPLLQDCIAKLVSNKKLETFSHEAGTYDENTDCEKYLLQNIDTSVVIVYPTRAIATGQWTKSVGFQIKSRQDERAEVERKVTQRSEIMSWYFGLTEKECTEEDKTQVRHFFRTITNNNSFTFNCTGQDMTIKVKENTDGEEHQLIKVPDGYFEAKHCAILFAFKQHKTICIEEAGKGMHPQMIERLRDLVLRTIKDKVIITTSHSPSLLSFWNLPRIFFFRKIRDIHNEDIVTFKVIDGKKILSPDEHKTSRMISTQSFASIFFARRVLYVEGDGDLLFMSILKQKLLQSDDTMKKLIEKSNISVSSDDVNKFLYSLQIIPLHGELNKGKFRKVSENLQLTHFFVLDYDSIERKQKNKRADIETEEHNEGIEGGQVNVNFFLEQFKLTDSITVDDVNEDVACLEKKDIFVWRKPAMKETRKVGTLERALIALVDENETEKLKKVFEENNIRLQWDPNQKTERSCKFGYDKLLTIENVENIIQAVLDCCLKGKGVDFKRLIDFWIQKSGRDVTC